MTTTSNLHDTSHDDRRFVRGGTVRPTTGPTSPYGRQVSVVLFTAFSLSAGYTSYLTAVGTADPNFSATTPAAWAFYALGFGLAALSKSARSCALWILAGALTALLSVAVFAYPSTFTDAQQTTFGWFENDIYTGLLLLALYLTVQRLRGITLVADSRR